MRPALRSTGTAAPTASRAAAKPGGLGRVPRPVVVGGAMVAAAGVSVVPPALAGDVSLAVLAVPIVAAVAWVSRGGAIATALMAGATSFGAAISWGQARFEPAMATDAALFAVLLTAAFGIPRLKTALADEHRASIIDRVTATLNRRGFEMVAERERMRAGREGRPLSIAYFDLDGFKRINDEHGRHVGDRVLAVFTAAVTDRVRATDVFARVGGDEFVLLLPNTDARQALVVVDRLRRILHETSTGRGIDVGPLTASVGVATYRHPPESVDAIVFGADDLMYEAKSRGGDTVVGQVVIGPTRPWDELTIDDEPSHPTGRAS